MTKGCTIEKMEVDGNCLFHSVARQIYVEPEEFQMVLDEVVDDIGLVAVAHGIEVHALVRMEETRKAQARVQRNHEDYSNNESLYVRLTVPS